MNHKDVKIGMKVVPFQKTPDGRSQGLNNSVVWRRALEKGQPFLYVTSKNPAGDYPECMLADEPDTSDKGDYFLSADFALYSEDKAAQVHVICLKSPKSVDSIRVHKQIFNLVASGVKTNEIFWKLDGIATDSVVKEMNDKFQVLKNRIVFDFRKDKKCVILNDTFNWVMTVDGRTICFTGGLAAEYFRDHFKGLGYEVTYDEHYYKTKEGQ